MTTLRNAKIDVGALGPGMAVLTKHCNAHWGAPGQTSPNRASLWPKHGLNARKHVFGLALASNTATHDLEIWAYVLWSPIDYEDMRPFADGCWFITRYTPEMWAELTTRRRIP